jgi:hypothetical protein
MKTLLVGIVLGVAAKMLWDSEYGDSLRGRVSDLSDRAMDRIDDGIHRAETAVETTAGKVDNMMRS